MQNEEQIKVGRCIRGLAATKPARLLQYVGTELPPRACAGHAPNGEFDSEPAIFIGMLNTSYVAKRVCSNASILLCDEHNVDGIMLIVILGPM